MGECHLRPDILMIWQENDDSIDLSRIGSHSKLFDKVRKT
ncbi:MAG: type II toxin-antitoxin system YafQ family toxin [Candidatus Pacebacteria bacterium]|nr:type II toxin-antitoxin system YafQ family toxin [Candidatus Paceibacterota bacterium]